MSVRKSILVAGLGNNIPPSIAQRIQHFDPKQIVQMVKADSAAAKEAGFDVETHFADPKEPEATTKEFVEKLRSQKWDGVMFGGGIRGAMELTELFENFVNEAIKAHPGITFGFSTSPSALLETARRMFPEMK